MAATAHPQRPENHPANYSTIHLRPRIDKNNNQTKETNEMHTYDCTVKITVHIEVDVEVEAANEEAAIEAAEIAAKGWTMSDVTDTEIEVDRVQLVDEDLLDRAAQ